MRLMHSMGDPDGLKDMRLKEGTARRVLSYTRPYRAMLVGFVLVIIIQVIWHPTFM